MRGKYFLLGFLLLKLMALVCKADGEPGLLGGFVMIATSNGSREEESASEETPQVEERCRGYFDVMGQWDPPFTCKTGNYLYCCGTCGFRFCCSYKHSRLDQSTCKNYDTPVWMKTGHTPYNKMKKMRDSTKDKTNLIVYIICGVVAIMALVGIFTKLGLEKAHRPQRENMSRAVASVLQGGIPNEQFRGEEGLGMHSQHFVSRNSNLQGGQVNNSIGGGLTMAQPQHPYPALGNLAHIYEQQTQQPNKDLNKYASLKAVAAKYNGELYNKRHLMVELPSKGGLPLQPMGNARQTMGNTTPPMTSNPMPTPQMSAPMAQMIPMTSMTAMTSMTPMAPMTSLSHMTTLTPMTSLGPLTPEPVATYTTLPTERHIAGTHTVLKPNGPKLKSIHTHPAHSSHSHPHSHVGKSHMTGTLPGGMTLGMPRVSEAPLGTATMGRAFAYSSNTISAGHPVGLGIKGWDGTETVGRRKAYGPKRPQCTILEPNQLHGTRGQSRSQHFLPTQPYFVTNSKTEVTV